MLLLPLSLWQSLAIIALLCNIGLQILFYITGKVGAKSSQARKSKKKYN